MSWSEAPSAARLPDGRLRLWQGPIDVVVALEGSGSAVEVAERRVMRAFRPVLGALCEELPRLRSATGEAVHGPVAQRMAQAVDGVDAFVTPMAAVAGAVADHLLAAALEGVHGLHAAHVNNGGDIAFWSQRALTLAVCDDPIAHSGGARASIPAGSGIHGAATSGWRGRSHSLGIADAVTVLARDAASADAAATLIANAVDLPGHPAITRRPACQLAPDSDLGARLVTVDVGALTPAEATKALSAGAERAERYRATGLIHAAALALQGERRMIGEPLAVLPTRKEPAHA